MRPKIFELWMLVCFRVFQERLDNPGAILWDLVVKLLLFGVVVYRCDQLKQRKSVFHGTLKDQVSIEVIFSGGKVAQWLAVISTVWELKGSKAASGI